MAIFHDFIESQKSLGTLILQPRMGFSDIVQMKKGLSAVRALGPNIIGTITIDSYTRTLQLDKAKNAIESGQQLNGYPICYYSDTDNRALIAGLYTPEFPVQVRHGSPLPLHIIEKILTSGLDATEGGPISYCLPYGRTSIELTIKAWHESCVKFSNNGTNLNHVESFGGCMLGQLCPPSLLIVIGLLEGLFFENSGIQSLSLSFAQGSNSEQDEGAIMALQRLASEYLFQASWHVVIYTFMGKFPLSRNGAKRIIQDSAKLAEKTHCARLIVKTAVEAKHIPAIVSNIEAIEWCQEVIGDFDPNFSPASLAFSTDIYTEAKSILETVLNLAPTIHECIKQAFIRGILDVPFCLHPDNRGNTSAWIDERGVIRWGVIGNVPIPKQTLNGTVANLHQTSSSEFLDMLRFNQVKYDAVLDPL